MRVERERWPTREHRPCRSTDTTYHQQHLTCSAGDRLGDACERERATLTRGSEMRAKDSRRVMTCLRVRPEIPREPRCVRQAVSSKERRRRRTSTGGTSRRSDAGAGRLPTQPMVLTMGWAESRRRAVLLVACVSPGLIRCAPRALPGSRLGPARPRGISGRTLITTRRCRPRARRGTDGRARS